MVFDLQVHDLAKFAGFGSINGQHDGLLEKGVLNRLQILIERDDPAAPRLVGEMNQLFYSGFAATLAVKEGAKQSFARCADNRQRILKHDSAKGAPQHDHGGSGLKYLADVATFKQQAGENPSQRQQYSN